MDELIRRIPLQPSHVELDAAGNFILDAQERPQLSSAVFKYKPTHALDGVSVDIMRVWLTVLNTEEQCLDRAAFSQRTKAGGFFMAGLLPAAKPQECSLTCVPDAIDATITEPANPAHALILGTIDKTTARNLADACRLAHRLPTGQLEKWPAIN
ncbi:hypothetical protein MTX78_24980 (plasmid) [Hymenobacter tibetensis]|uniref:Uncharacterized protein n=1 Tax=Hymenobacter tibetensis TaxID=497967 RepID=A0ABY4D551_9BACT|nr:hypothetical protein [Hymenobacter tibetensis]UOG77620.1 hypothetical protein MTX78_24980 [Hymenobacter tibetensis]